MKTGEVSPEQIREIVSRWALSIDRPVRVYIFGSRLKGSKRRDSDLDIAIESLEPCEDYSDFFFWWSDSPHKVWKEQLEQLTGLKVDLQHYDPKHSENLHRFLSECSEVVFESRSE